MKKLYLMVLRTVIPVFLVSIIFFVLLLELVDLFANLWRFLNQDVPLGDIMMIQLYYIPKCISYAFPVSILFSTSYCLGEFYARNELIAIFGAGISLGRFTLPFFVLGFFVSIFGFYFEENFVIDTFQKKNDLVREVLNQSVSFSNTNVTILGSDVSMIYHADYYNDMNKSLTGLVLTQRDAQGEFLRRIDAESAVWKDGLWELKGVRLYRREGEEIHEEVLPLLVDPEISSPPFHFRKVFGNVEEMPRREAREWILSLRQAGLSYRGALAEYYKRYSFALAPLVVSLLSAAVGGRFRKNVLLMSLLSSLVFSVVYYVMQMLLMLLAKLGYIAPLVGAWTAFMVFLSMGLFLMGKART